MVFKNNDERFECYTEVICIEQPKLNPEFNKIPTGQDSASWRNDT